MFPTVYAVGETIRRLGAGGREGWGWRTARRCVVLRRNN
ncbi:hypothetical protein RB1872 [Rhodopirellula baltica SH 1]|uniref:Uncharacterized protein n=1 Tax=Rhodopirellula baltica (strain DSM 10527 / NCIMB 13988 / SH1) TaxID=243090 RepID=Q7UWQ4_RHOBA|nr:hypothetical protein RB1872 [Rhodopirellula baltica SH 1]